MPPLTVAWAYCVLAAAVVAAVVADLRTGRIPNAVTLPAVALGLVGHQHFHLRGRGFGQRQQRSLGRRHGRAW